MKNVHILPPEIISKIAAGEVIDRPASVLKELVENAIDANTSSIEVQLEQAGKTLLSVRDTGLGIAEEDLETVFHRHATSKITYVEDLFDIHSLGFRGEALYSIAAIADVILRSKTREQDSGWEMHIRGGEKVKLKPLAMPDGTEIEVKELFFNTPARRKFLKSNTSEINHILDVLIPYALLYPHIRFLLRHGNRDLLDLKPVASVVHRIAETLNVSEDHLLDIQHEFDNQEIAVRAALGDMNISRHRRDMQFIFVNNRPVQNKSISFHLNNLYRLLLPEGRYPMFVLFVFIPPRDVDVNIHPTKREVKIRDEQGLATLIRHMCENALMSAGQGKQVRGNQETGLMTTASAPKPTPVEQALRMTHRLDDNQDVQERPVVAETLTETASSATAATGLPADRAKVDRPTEQYAFPQQTAEWTNPLTGEPLLAGKTGGLKGKLKDGKYIGHFARKFLFFESAKTLLVMDQHAAQERLTFEKLILQMQKGQVEVQQLLTPDMVELSPQDIQLWEQAQERLEQAGFSCTQFDDRTLAIQAYPVLVRDPVTAVREILSGNDVARWDHETLARRACKASVRAGDALKPEQAEYIRAQLLTCRDPFTCPHGRPTVIELRESFLDKQFLRT